MRKDIFLRGRYILSPASHIWLNIRILTTQPGVPGQHLSIGDTLERVFRETSSWIAYKFLNAIWNPICRTIDADLDRRHAHKNVHALTSFRHPCFRLGPASPFHLIHSPTLLPVRSVLLSMARYMQQLARFLEPD